MTKDPKDFTWSDLFKAIWYFMAGQRRQFAFWNIVLFVIMAYQLVPALFLGAFVDFFTKYKQGDPLDQFYYLVFALGLLSALVAIVRLTAKKNLGTLRNSAIYSNRVKGFEKILNKSLKEHQDENTGNKVQRIVKGMESLGSLLWTTADTFSVLTSIVGVIVFFIFTDIKYAIFLIAYIFLFFQIQKHFNAQMKKVQNEINVAKEKSSGSYIEGISNILSIKTLGMKSGMTSKINTKEQETKVYEDRFNSIGIAKWKLFNILNSVAKVVYLFMVGHDITTGFIGIGSLIIYYNYLINLTESAGESTSLIDKQIELRSGISRMMPIFWEENASSKGNLSVEDWQKISIQNGNFSYKTEEDSTFKITGINLEINKGERIGIAGRSGSGKSTLVKLLLGLYRLESGQFKIDKYDYNKLSEDDVTNRISVVLQESELFNMTLKENITVMKDFNEENLIRAIKVAQLEDLIEKLPDGLDSMIGEKGYRVSGGERQRIGIARAIYKNSDIIIFDEATSNLDSKTEEFIQKEIQENLKGKTLIFIAHRLSTLRDVDKIYVFDKGQIIEEGNFTELINNPTSSFAELYKIQKMDTN